LEVRSEPEHGTTVTMRIPLRRGSGISQKSADDAVCDFYHLAPR
jgi:hypothetical protein